MAAEALAPCVARSSAAMILTIWSGDVLVFHKSESQQSTMTFQCWGMIEITSLSLNELMHIFLRVPVLTEGSPHSSVQQASKHVFLYYYSLLVLHRKVTSPRVWQWHYTDAAWALRHIKSHETGLFVEKPTQVNNKEIIRGFLPNAKMS